MNGPARMPRHRRIVILPGAGISAESGLGTFRDVDGLWTTYDLDEVATPEGFARDPALVHAFYNARRRNLLEASPHFSPGSWPASRPGARSARSRPKSVAVPTVEARDAAGELLGATRRAALSGRQGASRW